MTRTMEAKDMKGTYYCLDMKDLFNPTLACSWYLDIFTLV